MDRLFVSHLHHQNLIDLAYAKSSLLIINTLLLIFIISSIRKKEPKPTDADFSVENYFSLETAKSLRGIAILLLVIGHFSQQCTPGSLALSFKITGNVAVIVFILISGIGLTKRYLLKVEKPFLINRVKRLFFPVWITLCLSYMLNYILINQEEAWHKILLNFFGIIWPGLPNSPCWFVTYIIFLYAIFFFTSSLNIRNIYKVGLILLLSYCSLLCIACSVLIDYFKIWMQYSIVFPIGVFIGLYRNKIGRYLRLFFKFSPWLYCFCLLLFFYYYYDGTGVYRVSHLIPSFIFTQIIFSIVNPLSLIVFLIMFINLIEIWHIRSKPLLFLGKYSFEIYLLHFPFMVYYDFFLFRKSLVIYFYIYLMFIIILSCILKNISAALNRFCFSDAVSSV